MNDTAIPVIDIGALRRLDPAGSRRIAAQLGRACRETGFFCIVNHGVPEAAIDAVFEHAETFFALSVEEK